MFKRMLRPGITAGVIGAVVSLLFSVLVVLTFLIGPVALILSSVAAVISLVLDLGYGFLAARLAQARQQEKLQTNEGAVAGLIAGIVSTVLGLAVSPAVQALQNALVSKDRITEMVIEQYRSMGMTAEQLDQVRAQMAQQTSGNTLAMTIAVGAVCVVLGIAISAGGGALGALVFKPRLRKLVCEKCQAAFELGGNAFIEVKGEGAPDLIDYCTWQDLSPDTAKQQRATVAQVLKVKEAGRQWQCGMCKTVQAY